MSGNYVAAKRRGVVDGVDFGYTGEVRFVVRGAVRQQLDNDNIVILSNMGERRVMAGDAGWRRVTATEGSAARLEERPQGGRAGQRPEAACSDPGQLAELRVSRRPAGALIQALRTSRTPIART